MDKNFYNIIKKNTMLNSKKLLHIVESVKYIAKNRIPGDIVECGVWMGGCSALMARAAVEHNDIRTLRLFDSFDDICEPTKIDGDRLIKQVGGEQNAQGRLQPVKGFYKNLKKVGPGNPKVVLHLIRNVALYPEKRIKIYKGWFQKTIPAYKVRIPNISLLVLDCDLYSSIKFCLEQLYEKVVPGGMVIIDDYFGYDGCKKAVNDFLMSNNIFDKLVQSSSGLVSWIK